MDDGWTDEKKVVIGQIEVRREMRLVKVEVPHFQFIGSLFASIRPRLRKWRFQTLKKKISHCMP